MLTTTAAVIPAVFTLLCKNPELPSFLYVASKQPDFILL